MHFRDVWGKNSMQHFKLTPADMCRGVCMLLLTLQASLFEANRKPGTATTDGNTRACKWRAK